MRVEGVTVNLFWKLKEGDDEKMTKRTLSKLQYRLQKHVKSSLTHHLYLLRIEIKYHHG